MRTINAVATILASVALSKIQIINPDSLKMEVGEGEAGYIEAGMANFGHIDYGSSIVSFSLSEDCFSDDCSFHV